MIARTLLRSAASPMILALCAVLAFGAGCGDDDGTNPSPTPSNVTATFSNFGPASPTEGHYELWISFAILRDGPDLRHSEAASAGKFRINASGAVVDLAGQPMQFAVRADDPNAPVSNGTVLWQLAVDAFVTVESEGDADEMPRLPGVLGGSFLNREATLVLDAADAIDVSFTGISGSFHLATPTDGPASAESEGVWFAAPGGATAALTLPALGAGSLWKYEGWIVLPTGTTSLGKFLQAGGMDEDGAGPLGGTGYAFPGSDYPFGSAGTDLSTGSVFVTIEPPGDADGSGPFFLKLLTAAVSGAAPGTSIPMIAAPVGFPTATVAVPRI